MTRLWGNNNSLFVVEGNKLVTNRECCCADFDSCAECIEAVTAIELVLSGLEDSVDTDGTQCLASNLNGTYLLQAVPCSEVDPSIAHLAGPCFLMNLGVFQDPDNKGIQTVANCQGLGIDNYVYKIHGKLQCFSDLVLFYDAFADSGSDSPSPGYLSHQFSGDTPVILTACSSAASIQLPNAMLADWLLACNEGEPLVRSGTLTNCDGTTANMTASATLLF